MDSYQNQTAVTFVSGAVAMLGLFRPDIGFLSRGYVVTVFDVLGSGMGDRGLFSPDFDGIVFGVVIRIDEGLLSQGDPLTLGFRLLSNIVLTNRSLASS